MRTIRIGILALMGLTFGLAGVVDAQCVNIQAQVITCSCSDGTQQQIAVNTLIPAQYGYQVGPPIQVDCCYTQYFSSQTIVGSCPNGEISSAAEQTAIRHAAMSEPLLVADCRGDYREFMMNDPSVPRWVPDLNPRLTFAPKNTPKVEAAKRRAR